MQRVLQGRYRQALLHAVHAAAIPCTWSRPALSLRVQKQKVTSGPTHFMHNEEGFEGQGCTHKQGCVQHTPDACTGATLRVTELAPRACAQGARTGTGAPASRWAGGALQRCSRPDPAHAQVSENEEAMHLQAVDWKSDGRQRQISTACQTLTAVWQQRVMTTWGTTGIGTRGIGSVGQSHVMRWEVRTGPTTELGSWVSGSQGHINHTDICTGK